MCTDKQIARQWLCSVWFDAGAPCGSAYLPAVRPPLGGLAPCGGPFGSRQALPHAGVSIEQVPMNHSTRGAARGGDMMHTLQPAFYLNRQSRSW